MIFCKSLGQTAPPHVPVPRWCLLFPQAQDDAVLDNRYQFIRSLSPNVMPNLCNLLQKQLNPNLLLCYPGWGRGPCIRSTWGGTHHRQQSGPENIFFVIFLPFLLSNKVSVRSKTIITKLLPNMTKRFFWEFCYRGRSTSWRIFVQTSCLKKEQYCPNLGFYNQIIFFEQQASYPIECSS